MNLEHFKHLILVAETKSISQVAQSLHLSQPYLSGLIKNIESEFQLQIFERHSKGVSITPLGHEFISHCHVILKEVQTLKSLHLNNSIEKSLSIVTNYSYSLLHCFYQFQNSEIKGAENFTLEETQNQKIPLLLTRNVFDLGIMHINTPHTLQWFKENHLSFIELYQEPIFAVVSKFHPLFDKECLQITDLQSYPLLIEKFKRTLESPNVYSKTLSKMMKSFKVENINFENNKSLFHYLKQSKTHFTIGQFSHNLFNPYVLSGDLKYIPISDLNETIITGILLNEKRLEEPLVQSFIQYMKTHYPKG